MGLNIFEAANVRKAVFLISFFIFLLFGTETFAAKCNFPPAWNKAGTCTIDIYYEDPAGGSDLDKCEYTTVSGTSPSCPTNGTWSSACSCSGLSTATCPITISIGSAGDCNVNGTSTCKVCSKATDGAGNTGYGESSFNIDYQAPGTTIKCNNTTCLTGWYNADISITLSCSDSHSGCDKTYYCIDQLNSCTPTTLYTGVFNLTTEGINYVRYYSTDIAGNAEPTKSKAIKLDKTGPKSEFTNVATPPAGSTVTNDFNVSVNDWDRPLGVDNSGLSNCYYSVYDSGVGYTKSGALRNCNSDLSFTVTVSPTGNCRTIGGTCTVSVYAYDIAGNPGDGQSRTFNISEATPPVTTLAQYLPDPTNDNTPTYSGVSADAQSQVVDIEYRIDGGSWIDVDPFTPALSVPFTFTPTALADGTHIFEARAKDQVGNWEQPPYPSDTLTIDTELPIVGTISPTFAEINVTTTFSADVSDNIEVTNCWLYVEGVNDGEMSLSLTPCSSCTARKGHTFTLTGDYSLYAFCKDKAENYGSGSPVTVIVSTPDTTPPYRVSWDPLSRGCTNANNDISVTVQYTDDESGIAETRYCWTTGASCTPTILFPNPNGGTATQSSTGNWTLCVKATDNASTPNSVTECEGSYIVDKTPPNYPSFNPASRDWSNIDASVTVTYTDNLCGITYTRHCWTETASCDPGTSATSTFNNGSSVTKSDTGVWNLCTRARDGAGNWRSADCSGPFKIDKILPAGTLEVTPDFPVVGQDITITISAQDGESGLDYLLAEDDGVYLASKGCGGAASCTKSWIVKETVAGDHTYCGLIYDLATNVNNTTPSCITVTITGNSLPVCNYLQSSFTAVNIGETVTFTGNGYDPDSDGTITQFEFDFGDEFITTVDVATPENNVTMGTTHSYDVLGTYCAKLRVKDNEGAWSINTGDCPGGTCTQEIKVAAVVRITTTVTIVSDRPPDKPISGGVSWDHCSVRGLSIPTFSWTYSDPDGDPQKFYEIQINNNTDFSAPKFTYLGESTVQSGEEGSFAPFSSQVNSWLAAWLGWGDVLYWRVRVNDQEKDSEPDPDHWSEWLVATEFTFAAHAGPWPEFTPSPDRVSLNQVVTFEDSSKCYTSPGNVEYNCQDLGVSYEWDFDYIEPIFTVDDTTKGNATTTYGELGNYKVKLRITDDIDTCYSETESVTVTLPLPEWREIPPF